MSKSPLAVALFSALVLTSLAPGCGDKKEKDRPSQKDDDDDDRPKKKSLGAVDAYKRKSLLTEAKNSVGAIARGAVGAYEREMLPEETVDTPTVHALCKSATPVPAKVPSNGESYTPKSEPNADFEAGDATTGWRCLKFTITSPIHFQYTYAQGGTPKLAARGKDVAKGDASFFEACAEADFEPGGKTTLICQTGQVKNDMVKIATERVELGEDD